MPMPRRALTFALLAVFAVQLFGAVVFASVCFEPCPDDSESSSCPPVCALCTSCTHAQQGIVQTHGGAGALVETSRLFEAPHSALPSQPAAEIFHVPLFG